MRDTKPFSDIFFIFLKPIQSLVYALNNQAPVDRFDNRAEKAVGKEVKK